MPVSFSVKPPYEVRVLLAALCTSEFSYDSWRSAVETHRLGAYVNCVNDVLRTSDWIRADDLLSESCIAAAFDVGLSQMREKIRELKALEALS